MSYDSNIQAAEELLDQADHLLNEETYENVTAQSLLRQLKKITLDLSWRDVAEKALEARGENPPRRGHVQMIALGLRDRLHACVTHERNINRQVPNAL